MDSIEIVYGSPFADESAATVTPRPVVDPRAIPVRFSRLKAIGRSPAHYYQACQSDSMDTLATRLGQGVHALMFDQPVVEFVGRRFGKSWEEFKQANAGKVILSPGEMVKARPVVESVRNHEIASRVLFADDTAHEVALDWTWMGRACRSTPDALGRLHLVDLKTTACSEPGRFARDGMFRSYHAQLAFYRQACIELGRPAPRDVYIVSVETHPPHVVTVMQLTNRALEQGERLCRLWMERLLVCEAQNEWPGYVQTIADFDVPDEEPSLVFGGDED